MKILYIDNRQYGHNADLHIDFIAHIDNNTSHKIYGYGKYLNKHLKRTTIPNMENVTNQLNKIVKTFKPDAILTYNCNGSSYEIGHDNVQRYRWVENFLKSI